MYLYYFPIKNGFALSLADALGSASAADVANPFIESDKPVWGTHWFYRLVAEVAAVSAAIFVAAGLARGRVRLASIIAAASISIAYILIIAFAILAWKFADPDDQLIVEPWYQYLIDGVIVVASPLVASVMYPAINEIHAKHAGLFGINRWHFAWLWVATYWYSIGLIAPIIRISLREQYGLFGQLVVLLVNLVPVVIMCIPAVVGLKLLSDAYKTNLSPSSRNALGVLVLIGGAIAGLAAEWIWFALLARVGASAQI